MTVKVMATVLITLNICNMQNTLPDLWGTWARQALWQGQDKI